jgi:hypothetical protein
MRYIVQTVEQLDRAATELQEAFPVNNRVSLRGRINTTYSSTHGVATRPMVIARWFRWCATAMVE